MSSSENYLTNLPRFSELGAKAIKPGTERVRDMLAALGNPQNSLSIVHVAGTNGKGTTSSLISSIFSAAGYSVGLFTSPHISSVRERFRIDGKSISHELLDDLVKELTPVFEREQPSFFEAVAVAALLHFSRQNVDAAVVEVGLGGRLDATNIVSPLVSVITQIGMDHTDLLGDTIEKIAAEKAGIIKRGVPIVTGASGIALSVIRAIAEDLDAPLHAVSEDVSVSNVTLEFQGSQFNLKTPVEEYEQLTILLPGDHQLLNTAIAVRCVEVLSDSIDVSSEELRRGLRQAQEFSGLSSRIECVQDDPAIVLDVSHNVDGVRAALQHVTRFYSDRNITVALASMKDKNIDGIISIFRQHNVHLKFVRLAQARAASPEHLRTVALQYDLESGVVDSVSDLIGDYRGASGEHDVLLILGSHLLVEQARACLD